MLSVVERVLNNDAQFIASSLFRSQSGEAIVVCVESAAVGPHGEEQHSGVPLFDRGEFLVSRTAIREQTLVSVRPLGIVDMGQ